MINWEVSPQDKALITQIANRACRILAANGEEADQTHEEMNITACHNNGMPLNLQKMLDADEFDFMHDVCGIDRHIDRNTGQLKNCFLPRFAQ